MKIDILHFVAHVLKHEAPRVFKDHAVAELSFSKTIKIQTFLK